MTYGRHIPASRAQRAWGSFFGTLLDEPQGQTGRAGQADDTVGGSVVPCATVYLRGEYDYANSRDLERIIRLTLDSATQIIIDLTRVTFIDSSCVRVFYRCYRTSGKHVRILARSGSAACRLIQLLDPMSVSEREGAGVRLVLMDLGV